MRIWNKNIGTAVIDLIDPCGIDSNGGFHADHSLVAGRAAGCGHCPDDHARHLTKKSKEARKARDCDRTSHRPADRRGFLLRLLL
jgi:hypothetical protein